MKTLFEEEILEIEKILSKSKIGVLATSMNDKVTARSMSIVNSGITILFQTDKKMEKITQIMKNNKVAMCINNIQIEGIAKIRGKASEDKAFIELFKERHESSYKAYTHMESEVVIEIQPTRIQIWDYIDGEPFIKNIEMSTMKVAIEKYQKD